MDDDLTASHWDDVLNPSQLHTSTFTPLGSQFGGLALDDPHKESEEESEHEQSDEHDEYNNGIQRDEEQSDDEEDHPTRTLPTSRSVFEQAELDQLQELKRVERKDHTSNLLSELTHGSESSELEVALVTPKKVAPSDSLFSDRGASLSVSEPGAQPSDLVLSPKRSAQLKSGQFKALRHRKYPAKTVVKHLNGNKSADPLGPLGAEDSPRLEETPERKAERLVQEANAPLYHIATETEEERLQKLSTALTLASTKVLTSAQNEDGNDLDISVGDPVKVGDITTAHIVYAIKTLNRNPHSVHFAHAEPVTVSRRYKDFRWIYHQLQNNHPGKIIPPPPTKQTYIGRFNENFIENRRFSLEKMLTKIAKIPVLANDADFVMFLTSENFATESKDRETISGSGASADNDEDENGSVSSSVPLVTGTNAATGFMSSLFSISTKVQEPDEYFSKKKGYFDDLEHNLKTFHKSLELIAGQRVEIVGVIEEIATTIESLAELEILKTTTELLVAFAEIHLKLKENLDRVNLQDQLTLGFTIEEYLRIIGSVKYVLETRTNIYQQYNTFNQELLKKQDALDRVNSKYKASVDKISLLNFEVDKLKQKVAHYDKSFTTISETIKAEIDNFEMEKIGDFRNSVEIYIESSIESQKEAIELWETFYERQNLALV